MEMQAQLCVYRLNYGMFDTLLVRNRYAVDWPKLVDFHQIGLPSCGQVFGVWCVAVNGAGVLWTWDCEWTGNGYRFEMRLHTAAYRN